MNRKIVFSIILTIAFAVLTAVPVMAAPPSDVQIVADSTIVGVDDPFIASGPAVDAGVLCASGTVSNLSIVQSGPPGGSFRILRVVKRFTCDDLSGTFDVKLVVNLDLTTHYTTANWNVVGGTGAYAGLHGNGSLVGTPIVPGVSITDVFDGTVH